MDGAAARAGERRRLRVAVSELPDFLVVGAGIIGLSIARELKRRERSSRVVVIEKEPRVAEHASGRNSGVLHAGFYYTPDSLKARFTRSGNERLTEYCLERKLPIRRCGKLVIATSAQELPRLDELHRRGVANGVTLSMISADDAREIEPRAKVFERAIWSPSTSTVDPRAVMNSLLRDAIDEGIDVRFNTRWNASMRAGFLVNAAGLEADAIARAFGLASDYRILPFKGRYLYGDDAPLRVHLYPVPDPDLPFLGIHFTVTVDGAIKIGPTAAPADWRGLLVIARDGTLRRHALREARKTRVKIVEDAARLASGVDPARFARWGTPGIRAQLYDTRRHALEMDFVIEGDARSMHVLNAVSPGFTCAMPFAEYVVDAITSRRSAPETRLP